MAKTVGDFVLARLRQWGVRRLFGYPGDGINGLLSALGRMEDALDFVQVRHEEEAAFMACGHAKFARGRGRRLPRDLRAGRDPPAERAL